MNKKFLTMAAAAMLFAACSDDLKEVQGAPEIAQNPTEVVNGPTPISFGAYLNRATTRAGYAGPLTNNESDGAGGWTNFTAYSDNGTDTDDTDDTPAAWSGFEGEGFGVFAFYTDNDLYSETAKPNFMYNERVYKSATREATGPEFDDATKAWTYSPVRYWPNETGVNAESDDIDRVSFFAYAPYVEVTASTGVVTGSQTSGIVGMTRNTSAGDPLIKYTVDPSPATGVDLCYGRAGQDYATETGTVSKGSAMLNMTKLSASDRLNFDFKHALAQLNVQIDAAIDDVEVKNPLDSKTRIYVRSITFEGFADKGMLNLRDGNWYDMTGFNPVSGSVTIFDGRSNGREAVYEATNETPATFNPKVVQSGGYNVMPGVTEEPVNLFKSDIAITSVKPTNRTDANFESDYATYLAADDVKGNREDPIMVIPTGQELRVNIVYDVETEVGNLPGYLSGSDTHGTSIENSITQTISGFKLSKGYKYTLNIHLGMVGAKFEASVSEWETPTTPAQSTNMPANIAGKLSDVKDELDALKAAVDASTKTAEEANTAIAALRDKYIGLYVNADGSIGSGKSTSTIGIIAQMEWEDSKIDNSTTALQSARIMVISANDVMMESATPGVLQNTIMWADPNTTELADGSRDRFTIPQSADGDAKFKKLESELLDGSSTVYGMRSGKINGYEISNDNKDVTGMLAIPQAFNYNLSDANQLGLTGFSAGNAISDADRTAGSIDASLYHWFLPTVEQMINMGASKVRYYSGGPTGTNEGVMSKLPSAVYWSCSEYNATSAWSYNTGNARWLNAGKSDTYVRVRPVFAY
ncbi:MAG: hypothetical protein IJ628_05315 [Bacteroidaceae bacterium]|nr:hypothetical protein [Bacteroidaceae bacterium]